MSVRARLIHFSGPWFRIFVTLGVLSACQPAPPRPADPPQPPTASVTAPVITAPVVTAAPSLAATVTPTPEVIAGQPPPCPITASRTPPPAAPTYSPDASGGDASGGQPRGVVDPHVEVCADRAVLAVGEVTTIEALAVDVGIPHYRLAVATDDGRPVEIGIVTYGDDVTPGAPVAGLEWVSATGGMTQASFTLRATQPGTYTLTLVANGEVHYGYPGPASWMAVASDPFVIQVED